MFESVQKSSISIILSGYKNKSFDAPPLNALNTANFVWDMCLWIFNEFIKDVKKTKNHLLNQRFLTRNTSRIISYCIHVCLLEGILEKLYLQTVEMVKIYIDDNISKDEIALKERKEEIKVIKKFRNKVAAHTVYSKPEAENDNISDELASISALTSWGFSNNDIFTFSIGGMVEVHPDVKPKHNYSMGLSYWQPKLEEHFQEWEKMFLNLLDQAEKSLPIKDRDFVDKEDKANPEYKLSANRDFWM